MKRKLGIALWVIIVMVMFVGNTYFFLESYGRHWTWGRYGMPRSILSKNKATHRDGAALGTFTRILVQRGIEEEASLVACALCGTVLSYVLYLHRQLNALRPRSPLMSSSQPQQQRTQTSLIRLAGPSS